MTKERTYIGLDNPIFAGRLRGFEADETRLPKPVVPTKAPEKVQKPVEAAAPEAIQPKRVEPIKFYFDDIENSKPKSYKQSFRFSRRYKFVSNSLIFLALILLSFGVYVAVSGMKLNKNIQGAHASAQATKEKPDETQPTTEDLNTYTVAPDMPRFIYLDKFNEKGRVRHLGTNSKGAMQAPNNVFDAGWYNQSAKPGSAGGASVIAGHVSGLTRPGVFHNLKRLNQGDTITIERGDGSLLKYAVVATEVYDADKVDMNKVMVSHDTAKHGLNLITCTGQYQGTTYTQRLVVYTELVQ